MKREILMQTDSNSAKGICYRLGYGKVKHLETRQLWLQSHVADKRIIVKKIPREVNFSDVLTHHWNGKDGERHLTGVGLRWR